MIIIIIIILLSNTCLSLYSFPVPSALPAVINHGFRLQPIPDNPSHVLVTVFWKVGCFFLLIQFSLTGTYNSYLLKLESKIKVFYYKSSIQLMNFNYFISEHIPLMIAATIASTNTYIV